jgi:hypothetical protein
MTGKMTVDEIIDIEKMVGRVVKPTGEEFLVCCPCHEDRTPSCSIKMTTNDMLLVHCFAGCPPEKILEAFRNRKTVACSNLSVQKEQPLSCKAFKMVSKEELEKIVRRIYSTLFNEGYHFTDYFPYLDSSKSGEISFIRLRFERVVNGQIEKEFRPLAKNQTDNWIASEPKFYLPFGVHSISENSDRIFIVEGEKCARALHDLKLPAITSGSSNSGRKTDWSVLRGHRIIIWRDNDTPGLNYQNDIFRYVKEFARTVQHVMVEKIFENTQSGEDCVNFILACRSKGESIDEIRERILAIETGPLEVMKCTSCNPPKDDIHTKTDPFPLEALPEDLREAVKAGVQLSMCDQSMAAVSVLSVINLCVQHIAKVESSARDIPIADYYLIIAGSGERKTTVENLYLKGPKDYERSQIDAYNQSECQRQQDIELRKLELKRIKKKDNNDPNKENELRMLLIEPPPLPSPHVLITEGTPGGIFRRFQHGRDCQGLFTSEAGGFFGGHGFSMQELRAMATVQLSQLWDGSEIERNRTSEESVRLYNKQLSMCGQMQENFAADFFLAEDVQMQGLLSRFQIVWPMSRAGTRIILEGTPLLDLETKKKLDPFHDKCKKYLEIADNRRFRILTLSTRALLLWREYYNSVESSFAPDGEFAGLNWLLNKSGEHALRLSATLALWQDPNCQEISVEAMQSATKIGSWFINQSVIAVQKIGSYHKNREAKQLLSWLKTHKKVTVTPREILQYGPAWIRGKKTAGIESMLLTLSEWGCAGKNLNTKGSWTISLN